MKRFSIVLLCLCLSGCVAMFKPEKRIVSFGSNPPGATVFVENVAVGITPVKVALMDGYPTEIVLRKEGYAPAGETIQTHLDTFWLIMQNIPIPVFGTVIGSYWENMNILDKKEIYYDLEPGDSSSQLKSRKK